MGFDWIIVLREEDINETCEWNGFGLNCCYVRSYKYIMWVKWVLAELLFYEKKLYSTCILYYEKFLFKSASEMGFDCIICVWVKYKKRYTTLGA